MPPYLRVKVWVAFSNHVGGKVVGVLVNVVDNHAPQDTVVNLSILEKGCQGVKQAVAVARHGYNNHCCSSFSPWGGISCRWFSTPKGRKSARENKMLA